jgi:hypothetical protein
MKVRIDFTESTTLECALHDTLLEFNGDFADCIVTVGAKADITFKPRQLPSPAQQALEHEQAAVEVDFPEFLRLLCGIVQIVDGHVNVRRPSADREIIIDIRVVDSSFVLIETDHQGLLQALQSRLRGERRT